MRRDPAPGPVTPATLRALSKAAAALRTGFTASSAAQAAGPLRSLLATPAIALTSKGELLTWVGVGAGRHAGEASGHAARAPDSGRAVLIGPGHVVCDRPTCPIRYAALVSLVVRQRVAGTLVVYSTSKSRDLTRTTAELARWISGQLDAADPPSTCQHLSPHFVFNSLTTIASLMHSDPDHARDLLQDFADLTRYSLRRHRALATVREELDALAHVVLLARARFSDRLQVTVDAQPETLDVPVPFLSLQSLVVHAIRQGMESKSGPGRITVAVALAADAMLINVENDGLPTGADAIEPLDGQLRATFGEGYGVTVRETAGVGNTVTMRVPRDG